MEKGDAALLTAEGRRGEVGGGERGVITEAKEDDEKVQNYFYEPLTWDEVLLFGCDGEKKEGRMSVLMPRAPYIYKSLYMTEHDWR